MLHVLKLDDRPVTYSAIVLFEGKNRQAFPEFLRTMNDVLCATKRRYEIIIVSSGPFDVLDNEFSQFQNEYNSSLKIFELSKRVSETVCFKSGFEESCGDIIISCGSYQQITGESLVELLDSMEDGIDMVCSWRNSRLDSTFIRIQSSLFNRLVRAITKSEFHDLSSSVRLLRRRVIQETEIYGNMYRFLPILAMRNGFKAKEIKCSSHQPCGDLNGSPGSTKYIERITDILTLYFISSFASKPLRFFGFLGVIFLLVGIGVNVFVLMQKFFFGLPLGDRPFLLLGMFLVVLGIQAASTGLLGEIISFVYGRHKRKYTIEKQI